MSIAIICLGSDCKELVRVISKIPGTQIAAVDSDKKYLDSCNAQLKIKLSKSEVANLKKNKGIDLAVALSVGFNLKHYTLVIIIIGMDGFAGTNLAFKISSDAKDIGVGKKIIIFDKRYDWYMYRENHIGVEDISINFFQTLKTLPEDSYNKKCESVIPSAIKRIVFLNKKKGLDALSTYSIKDLLLKSGVKPAFDIGIEESLRF